MNVVWVIHYPVFGGPHNRALRIVPLLEERGVATTVVLPDLPGNAAERLRSGGVEVVQVPLSRVRETLDPREHVRLARGLRADVRTLRGVLRRRRADVVVVGGLVNPQAPLAGRLEDIGVVWQVVDTRTPWAARVVMMPLVARLADTVMFGADALVDTHPGAGRLRVPSVVSRPAVDADRFRPDPERRRSSRGALGLAHDAPVVGTVANVVPQKGIEFFARAAGLVRARLPSARFLVVGARDRNHADYQARVDREFREAGVEAERIVFTGARPDVEALLPAMDVKLVTSVPRSEGTTTTAMEAMACGVPVVATDVGGVKEVVLHGDTGFVVPPRDPQALAERTLEVLGDDSLRLSLSASGRRHAAEHLGLAAAAQRQLESYDLALAHRRSRRR